MNNINLYDIEFTVEECKGDLIKAVSMLKFLRDNFGNLDIIYEKAVEIGVNCDESNIGVCAFIHTYIDELESNKTHDYLVTMYSLDQKRDLRYISYAYPVGGYSEFRAYSMDKLWSNNDRLAYIESNIKYLTEIIDNYDTNRTYKFPSKPSK